MRTVMLSLAGVLIMTGAANAAERTAYPAIASGDLAAAERMLVAERRIYPDRPELMLNLAAVYARTGRAGEARALYQAVRARPASVMDLPDGATASSHDVAARGLNRLAPAYAAR